MLKAIRATHAFNLIFKHYYTHTALCICFCTKYNIYVRMSIHFIPYEYIYKDNLAIVPVNLYPHTFSNSIGYFEWLSVQPEQGNACVKLAFLQRTCEFRFNNCKLVIVPTPRKTPHTHTLKQTNTCTSTKNRFCTVQLKAEDNKSIGRSIGNLRQLLLQQVLFG